LAATPQLAPGVLLAWFDRWVAGLPDVPVPPEPTFTSFEGPVGTGAGWRELDRWDPTGDAVVELLLVGDGTLGAAAGPGGTATVHQPVPPHERPDVAIFTAAPLALDQVLLGHPSLTLQATLDAPEAHLYVELVDVDADGGETVVNDGFLAATHRGSHTDPEPAPVGERTELRVPIRAAHHRFVAGHRVRLRVSGGAPSKLTPPPAAVTVTIATDGTAVLRLPGFNPDR
jgi:predicted acyl esterase